MPHTKTYGPTKTIQKGFHTKQGDMLLLKQKSVLSSKYQYGMMKSVSTGIIWKVNVELPDISENVEWETFHSVQQLVMIHAADELNLVQEFGETVCAKI